MPKNDTIARSGRDAGLPISDRPAAIGRTTSTQTTANTTCCQATPAISPPVLSIPPKNKSSVIIVSRSTSSAKSCIRWL